MPNKDGTGPTGAGARTGRGQGDCDTIEKRLTNARKTKKGLGPCGDGTPNGGGGAGRGKGRRKGENGVTYFT